MDLAILMEEFDNLVEAGDFAGGEDIIFSNMGALPKHEAFLHFQLGRLYIRWNKMTSAVQHLGRAAELSYARSDEVMTAQVLQELKRARRLQLEQTP